MRSCPWWWRHRVRAGGDERGATLVLALVFITVISVVIVGTLSVVFANLRATNALREQAIAAAAAEGAAQIAINELRRSAYTGAVGSACFGGADTLTIPPVPGGSVAATVECTHDAVASAEPGPDPAFPWALITLATPSVENGMRVRVNGVGTRNRVEFAGPVSSTSHVWADHGVISVTDGTFTARTCEIDNQGTIEVDGEELTESDPQCNTPGRPDPDLALPPGTTPAAPDPWTFTAANGATQGSCVNGNGSNSTAKITFHPGVYRNLSNSFRSLFTCGRADIIYDFRPGVYWFDFTFGNPSNNGDFAWSLTKGRLVAGSPTEVPLASSATEPFPTAACEGGGAGALFVFGGRTQWSIENNARVQLCGRAPTVAGAPRLAIYGLKNGIGSVNEQSGCVTAPSGCRALSIKGTAQAYVYGVTYLPRGWIDIDVNGPHGPYPGAFAGGVVARRFDLRGTGSVRFEAPLAAAPPGPGVARTVVHLAVYVCPGSTTCDASDGRRYLAATVGLDDPSGLPVAGQREVTVYSWSVQP